MSNGATMSAASGGMESNAFDLIRVILATIVLEFHVQVYTQSGGWLLLSSKDHVNFGSLAVLAFFGMSGFLITASYDHLSESRNTSWEFIKRRVARIMPAYWLSLLLTAFVLAPAIWWLYHRPLAAFDVAGPDGAWNYVARNAALRIRQFGIGDVLRDAPTGAMLNPNYWSLFPEIVCYALTLALGVLGLCRGNRWMAVFLALALTLLIAINLHAPDQPYGPTLLVLERLEGYFAAYFVGSALFCFRKEFQPADWRQAVFAGGLLVLLFRFGGLALFGPLLIPVFVINIAQLFTCRLQHDLSYGIYVLGAPVLQVLLTFGFMRRHVLVLGLSSLLLTAAVALVSWLVVERPILRLVRRR
jgi:peptidoglycan/LPS O-acetylase OafA/YrhL